MDVSSFFQVLAQLVLWRFYTSFLARDLRDSRSSSRLKSLCILNPTKATSSENWRMQRVEKQFYCFYFVLLKTFKSGFCLRHSLFLRESFEDQSVFLSFSAVQMYNRSYIHVYFLSCTKWSAPSWLDSSVGRVLHQYRRGHGFESRSSLNFSRSLIFTTAWVVSVITAMINHLFISFRLWHEEVQKRPKHPQETKVKRKMVRDHRRKSMCFFAEWHFALILRRVKKANKNISSQNCHHLSVLFCSF